MSMDAVYSAKVVGVTSAKGSFKDDSGKVIEYDNTKVFVEIALRGETARGIATEAFKIGPSNAYLAHRFATVKLPFDAKLTVRKTTNGRETREEVIAFEVVGQAPANPLGPESKAAA
ncbi:hypothetical protein [Chitinolyticbacter meiyuanensis]|uniref:hypothetical protein n=1 Tax=Chitinolyticbacter meiyuanensis TaxID=682798 RepID=UPI0011E5B0D1|nr:hypothetical protein [Chitinolyticbacter meiyuanensis]